MTELIPVLKCERQFVSPVDLLQVVGIGRQYFCVQSESGEGRVLGSIWIKSGFVVGAESEKLTGRHALFSILSDTSVVAFSVYRPQPSPTKYPAPLGSIAELLLEAAELVPAAAVAAEAGRAQAGLRLAPAPPPAPLDLPPPAALGSRSAQLARTGPEAVRGKIVAFASAKGGVGKTTLALNIALAFAESGQSVLLVDADPLGGIGHSLAGEEARRAPGTYDVLLGRCGPRDAVLPTRVPALKILPAGALCSREALDNLQRLTDSKVWRALLEPLSDPARLVIVDLPAGLYGIPNAVLRACTHAFAILEAEPLALRVLPQLLQSLEEREGGGSRTVLAGVILNSVQFRTGASVGVVQGAWASFAQGVVLETTVPRDTAFLDASAAGVPVAFLDRAKRPPVASVFRHLADDIAGRIGLNEVMAAGEPRRLI